MLYSMQHLGVEVQELERWNCCGTVSTLVQDDVMRQLAPVRNLIRVKEAGATRVMTACAMCYNTLKRANERVKADPKLRERMNTFMYDEEVSYEGDVEVAHVLEILRELKRDAGNVAAKVVKPLNGLRVACYYGCLLVRPRSIAFDNVEDPVLLDELVTALGGKAVDFSHKTECCGAYQTVDKPEIVASRSDRSRTGRKRRSRLLAAPSVSRPPRIFRPTLKVGAGDTAVVRSQQTRLHRNINGAWADEPSAGIVRFPAFAVIHAQVKAVSQYAGSGATLESLVHLKSCRADDLTGLIGPIRSRDSWPRLSNRFRSTRL